jgi:hypothetical protein
MSNQPDWRFCIKCSSMFWNGDLQGLKGACARDGGGHDATGFNFVLDRDLPASENIQPDWRFCVKCFSMFWDGDSQNKGVCAKDGTGHVTVQESFKFSLSHTTVASPIPESLTKQANWRFCVKCFSMFWDAAPLRPDGSLNKGICARDREGHEAAGFNFVLSHDTNPSIQISDDTTRVLVSGQGFIPRGRVSITYSYKDGFTSFFPDPIDVDADNDGRFRNVSLDVLFDAIDIAVRATDIGTNLFDVKNLR